MMSASSYLDLLDGKADIRRFTRADYRAMVDAGVLAPEEALELLDGLLHTMSAQGPDHSRTVGRIDEHLHPLLLGRAEVLMHSSFAASDLNEPVTDLLIFALDTDASDHPKAAYCAFEISVTSQRHDRRKVAIYARAKVPQLVLIDIPKREARVFRNPHDGDYALIERVPEGAIITIDAFPDVTLDLAAVLPKKSAA